MEWVERLNQSMNYIEEHLTGEIDYMDGKLEDLRRLMGQLTMPEGLCGSLSSLSGILFPNHFF